MGHLIFPITLPVGSPNILWCTDCLNYHASQEVDRWLKDRGIVDILRSTDWNQKDREFVPVDQMLLKGLKFIFNDPNDALLFKLIWGGQ